MVEINSIVRYIGSEEWVSPTQTAKPGDLCQLLNLDPKGENALIAFEDESTPHCPSRAGLRDGWHGWTNINNIERIDNV